MDEFLCKTMFEYFRECTVRGDRWTIEKSKIAATFQPSRPITGISEAKRAVKRSLESTGRGIYDRIGS